MNIQVLMKAAPSRSPVRSTGCSLIMLSDATRYILRLEPFPTYSHCTCTCTPRSATVAAQPTRRSSTGSTAPYPLAKLAADPGTKAKATAKPSSHPIPTLHSQEAFSALPIQTQPGTLTAGRRTWKRTALIGAFVAHPGMQPWERCATAAPVPAPASVRAGLAPGS